MRWSALSLESCQIRHRTFEQHLYIISGALCSIMMFMLLSMFLSPSHYYYITPQSQSWIIYCFVWFDSFLRLQFYNISCLSYNCFRWLLIMHSVRITLIGVRAVVAWQQFCGF